MPACEENLEVTPWYQPVVPTGLLLFCIAQPAPNNALIRSNPSGKLQTAAGVGVGVEGTVAVGLAVAVGVAAVVEVGLAISVGLGEEVGVGVDVGAGLPIGLSVGEGVGVGHKPDRSSAPISGAMQLGRESPSLSSVTPTSVPMSIIGDPTLR